MLGKSNDWFLYETQQWGETGLVDTPNEEDQKKLDIFLCILPN